jgi:deoxyhypusine synthase
MEMFEWREKISGTQSTEEKLKLTHEIMEIIGFVEKAFQTALDDKNEERAMKTAIKLKYYSKVCCVLFCSGLFDVFADVGRAGYVDVVAETSCGFLRRRIIFEKPVYS